MNSRRIQACWRHSKKGEDIYQLSPLPQKATPKCLRQASSRDSRPPPPTGSTHDAPRQQALEDLDFVWADQGGDGDSGTSGGSTVWECGWIPAADMTDHLLHSCPRRSAPCREGCGQSLVVMEAERHYQDHCPKRCVGVYREAFATDQFSWRILPHVIVCVLRSCKCRRR